MKYAIGWRSIENKTSWGVVHSQGLQSNPDRVARNLDRISEDFPEKIFFIIEVPDA